ncbi:hypothetical protein GCM10027048_24940 [Hymenobacter coalescens]
MEFFEFNSASGLVPVLRFPNGTALALPQDRTAFQQLMLTVVGDHPVLGSQLRAGQYDVIHARPILEYYLRDKPGGFGLIAQPAAAPTN